MAQIISFIPKKKVSDDAKRWKAIAKGQFTVYTCDNCGERFEVINDEYPDTCPGCGLRFTKFNQTEEKI